MNDLFFLRKWWHYLSRSIALISQPRLLLSYDLLNGLTEIIVTEQRVFYFFNKLLDFLISALLINYLYRYKVLAELIINKKLS